MCDVTSGKECASVRLRGWSARIGRVPAAHRALDPFVPSNRSLVDAYDDQLIQKFDDVKGVSSRSPVERKGVDPCSCPPRDVNPDAKRGHRGPKRLGKRWRRQHRRCSAENSASRHNAPFPGPRSSISLPGHRSTLVSARSINWEPRPSSTALIKNSPKFLASTGVVFGGRISSWRALATSTRAGPSC